MHSNQLYSAAYWLLLHAMQTPRASDKQKRNLTAAPPACFSPSSKQHSPCWILKPDGRRIQMGGILSFRVLLVNSINKSACCGLKTHCQIASLHPSPCDSPLSGLLVALLPLITPARVVKLGLRPLLSKSPLLLPHSRQTRPPGCHLAL